tara:strand:- start:619 stop:1536 length:918 start_codon:yes stop_codon:yes gene_type:complete
MSTRRRRFEYSAVEDNNTTTSPECLVCGVERPPYSVVNAVAAFIHLIQAAVLILLTTTQSLDRSVPLQEQYTNWIPKDKKDTNASYTIELDGMALNVATVPTKSEFSIAWGVIVFFLLSGVFQCVNLPCCRKEYKDEKTNPLRFIEYSFSASIMLVLIALVNGIFDQSIITLIAVSCAACQLCGLVAEQLLHLHKVHEKNKELSNNLKVLAWVSHLIGWLLIITAYAIIFRYYDVSNRNSDGQAPEFVTAIVISIFILFSSFGVVQLLQMTNTLEYDTAELVYVCLSLTAKTVLGWIIYANVLVN